MEKKVAMLSVNNNPDYLFVLPLVAMSWSLQGFTPFIVFNDEGEEDEKSKRLRDLVKHTIDKNMDAYHVNVSYSSTIEANKSLFTQCIRLYMPLLVMGEIGEEVYAIVGDADMFIGSSFLYRDTQPENVNVFGFDLTGKSQVPMCYVGMSTEKWLEVMKYNGWSIYENMTRDVENYKPADTKDWEKNWGIDQQIITEKLKEYGFNRINFFDRGTDSNNSGLPMGRLDRYNWQYPQSEIHDAHLLRNPTNKDNFFKLMDMCHAIYNRDWSWVTDYYCKFNEILNDALKALVK